MRIAVAVGTMLMVGSCTSSTRPTAAEPEPTGVCATMGHGALYVFHASLPALEEAQRAYDAAGDAPDHAAAAQAYLACAAAYRAVPDDFAELAHVIANTQQCYRAAIVEYYNGQILERVGRATVTAALADEPRVKADIEAELAGAKECTDE